LFSSALAMSLKKAFIRKKNSLGLVKKDNINRKERVIIKATNKKVYRL
jgi:hypothetical protein